MEIRRLCADTRFQFCLVAIALFATGVFVSIRSMWGDVDHYWVNISEVIIDGRMPYSETQFEYPPLALVIFAVPRLLSWDLESFRILYAFFAGLTYLVSMWFAFRIGDRLGVSHVKIFAIFLLSVIWLFEFIIARYDIYTVVLVLAAIDQHLRRRYNRAAVIIGIAAMTKLYPVLVIFAFIYPFVARRDWKSAVRSPALCALVCVLVMVPFMVYDMSSAFDWISYHSARGIQVESVIGTILEVGSFLDPGSVTMINNYGSDNITGAIPDAIAPYMNYVLAAGLLAMLIVMTYAALRKEHSDTELERSVIMTSLILILAFIVFNKVYSAQYGLWAILLVPLLYFGTNSAKTDRTITIVTLVFGCLSMIAAQYYRYSVEKYVCYDILSPLSVVELMKNIATIALLILVLKLFWDQFKDKDIE